MQVRAITVNAAGLDYFRAERNIQGKTQGAAPADDTFGPRCRVTISQEGRSLSRQQTEKDERAKEPEELLEERSEETLQSEE